MKNPKMLFTSESVSEGHPDKLCDQVADAILDECLKKDPSSRVACECFTSTNYLLIGGEITCKSKIDFEKIARRVINDIGYNDDKLEMNGDNCQIDIRIKEQSPDIALGVNKHNVENMGAGDQGIMFGYATNESEGYMPLAISIAHKLVRKASQLRKQGLFKYARPDMKSQVTIDYSDINYPRVNTVLMSVQHDEDADLNEFKEFIENKIMIPVVKSFGLNTDFKVLINPTGRFVIGGPAGDTGLTGRKIIVDTYGGTGHHGGGSFSGKDPSKVDRSATYMARYIAKNLVAAGLADRLEIQISYAIGMNEPISVGIRTFGTAHYPDDVILGIISNVFDLRPGMIIENLKLNKPPFKYESLASYGHFGRPDLDLPWEKLDKVEEIKKRIK